jgi:transcription antitermination factor NusG
VLAVMAYWAVIRAVPNHDRLAAESVCQAGFETFTPKIRRRVGARWRTTPLFGCYFFVRVVDRWRAIERAMGVHSVVRFGATPARCPDAEIAKLIARTDPDGVVRLSPRPLSPSRRILTPGAAVAIADGPLRGLGAIYAGQTAREREIILLHILGASRPVEISAGLVLPQ